MRPDLQQRLDRCEAASTRARSETAALEAVSRCLIADSRLGAERSRALRAGAAPRRLARVARSD